MNLPIVVYIRKTGNIFGYINNLSESFEIKLVKFLILKTILHQFRCTTNSKTSKSVYLSTFTNRPDNH